ncbi:glycoside hydrolase family 88 protein [Duganella sp. HH101]|uniref:glycoside hydrolase family 88 protein n=1 Tax=Duganella sp. HH101 TaxID=1781066 RepID=UPI0008754CD8|nr:glycoside hydrolase family 88 protein [Duganella sp. HH101]OFA03291.1 unsaturated chondroitin disaccharide hydrolase [Duganella sp. HH101]
MIATSPSPTIIDKPQAMDLEAALQAALTQLSANLPRYTMLFPDDTSHANHYEPRRFEHYADGANTGWTTGFWTGMLWMAHELSGKAEFREAALAQLPSYGERLAKRINIDHHDLGFLYMPSCVAAYRITGDEGARKMALDAADHLMQRYLPKAGIIQAWGDLSDPQQRGRIIIDCLMNLPLLHWAGGKERRSSYKAAAMTHALRSRDYLVRSDDSSFHTFHFDPQTGAPLRGSTAQGWSDDSCWARGQAWGIYGFALNHRYAPHLGLLQVAMRQADYFLRRLPANGIAYWDLAFDERSGEPWDSSASAIAVCGLLELSDQLEEGEPRRRYRAAALHILDGLVRLCAAQPGDSNALLLHGVYSKPHGHGVDEANLWGDFFYLEALSRVARGMAGYW